MGEVESRGNKKHASLLADSLSLLLKITNGDYMTDNKLMNEPDPQWQQRYCLSCHSPMNYNLSLCEVCAPWTLPEKTQNPEARGGLEQITMIEFLNDDNYQDLILRGMPDNDDSWRVLISSIITLAVGGSESPLHEQFLNDTDELLNHITRMQDRINEYTDKLSRNENLALSYYSHFVDLDVSHILDDDSDHIVQFEIKNQSVIFRVFRLKGGNVPSHAYRFPKPTTLYSDYYAEIVSINGYNVSFDYKDLEGCAEMIIMLDICNKDIDEKVEFLNRKYCEIIDNLHSHQMLSYESLRFLPNSVAILTEIDGIINGKYGDLVRDLLLCSLYVFENWKWVQNVRDSPRTRSFQFLRRIVSDLESKVVPYGKGLEVTSITGNCYQVCRLYPRTEQSLPQVFWTVLDVGIDDNVCLEVEKEHGLPMGDILGVIILSLYDDLESSQLLHTLNI
jgi:hypothetical protein